MLPQSVIEMHERGEISQEQFEKLAQVQASLMTAATSGPEAVLDVVVSEFELADVQDNEYEKIATELELFLEGDMQKLAQGGLLSGAGGALSRAGNWLRGAGPSLRGAAGIVSGGLLLGMGAAAAGKAIKGRIDRKKSLASIKNQFPELRKDKDTDQYFNVISEFAPSVARNPTVAGNLVQKFKEYGYVDHKSVQDLIGMEKSIADTSRPPVDVGTAVRVLAG
jgi:hypothetical protein